MEGISRALRIFNGKEEAPDFIVTPAQEQITVEPTARSSIYFALSLSLSMC
jgi:hypothetical protein